MALSTTQYGYIIDPMVPFTDDKGKTIKNGFVRVFVAGSSTPVVTYRNFNGATNQDRIELDNSGRTKTSVIGSKGFTYKVCVYDKHHSQESPILTVDKVSVIGANITAGTGATVVTGLDGLTTKPDGFVDASVVGTDGYVALDHTLVTDDLNTDAKVTAVENDRYVPLLNEDVNDPDSKMTLGRLWQWVLGKINSLATTATEADLVSGNYLALDGSAGAKKLPAEAVAKRSVQDGLATRLDSDETELKVTFFDNVISSSNASDGSYSSENLSFTMINGSFGGLQNFTVGNTFKMIYKAPASTYYSCRVFGSGGTWKSSFFVARYITAGTIFSVDFTPASGDRIVFHRSDNQAMTYDVVGFDITGLDQDVIDEIGFDEIKAQYKYVFIGDSLPKKSEVPVKISGTFSNVAGNLNLSTGCSYAGVTFTCNNGNFEGIELTGNHRYIIILKAPSANMYRCRTLYNGSWVLNPFDMRAMAKDEVAVVDIKPANTSIFCFQRQASGTSVDYEVVIFDVSGYPDSIANSIYWGEFKTTYSFEAYDMPRNSVAGDCVTYRPQTIPQDSLSFSISGKKIAYLGDSITEGGTWQKILDKQFGFARQTMLGVGGSRVSGTAANAFWQDTRVNGIPTDTDVIIIMGGTNDSAARVDVGTASLANHDTSNFIGAYNVLVSKILYKFGFAGYYNDVDYTNITKLDSPKNVLIVVATCPFCPNTLYAGTSYEYMEGLANAAVSVGKFWGIPVADVYHKAGINPVTASKYIDVDLIHPNTDGGKMIAPVMMGAMLEVPGFDL